ncbi:universal stress protein [Geodermatophilus sp. DSM 44513]|uniref:universal stress protein n=1 Tax=Geodermatophilus sp. DSM 44513 TaxID=1528104 RepID=UPI0014122DEE|nr:universal stress protein [Geodermatophilus sp. DSM 44513]WNV75389.1 universal stress protein [Geodermatophilus sp. DSM 44513]
MQEGRRLAAGPEEGRRGTRATGDDARGCPAAAVRPAPLLPRRPSPWLLVDVDGSSGSHEALVWALQEAARREATVVVVCAPDETDDRPGGRTRAGRHADARALERLDAEVLRALAETGVSCRVRTAVVERPVLEALTSAARGADLVVVGGRGKTLLRRAVPRHPARRLARGA